MPEELDHILFITDGRWLAMFKDGTRREMTSLEKSFWTRGYSAGKRDTLRDTLKEKEKGNHHASR